MKPKNKKKPTVAMSYRMLKDEHEVLREYCWRSRISIQHFIDCAVAQRMRDHKIKVPS